MSDPQHGKYEGNIGGGGDGANPDAGKDLSYLVPHLEVIWSSLPSFNFDPANKGGSQGEGGGKDAPACGPIRLDTASLRAAEDRMLAASRTIVGEYESLRSKVMSGKDTVFGQTATITKVEGGQSGVSGNSYNGVGAGVPEEKTVNSPIQEAAAKFADGINPAQEKVLWQVANSIELVGQYIAAVNRAGQTYGRADRLSLFPAPPASSTPA